MSNVEPSTFDYELTKHEIELIEQISRFPQTVQQAANEYRPLVMAAYAYDLANAFHSFYHAVPVLQTEDENIKNARLRLVAAAKQTIANCAATAGHSSAGGHVKNRLNVIFTFSLFYLTYMSLHSRAISFESTVDSIR